MIQDEREDFKDVVNAFQKHLPLKKEPDLLDDWEYLYLYSAGCVGILKNWLTKSLKRALEDNERKEFKSYLEKHQMKNKKLRLLLASIEKGEQMMLDEELSSTTLQKLGLSAQPIKNNSGSRGRVGTRNPQRDQVGTNA